MICAKKDYCLIVLFMEQMNVVRNTLRLSNPRPIIHTHVRPAQNGRNSTIEANAEMRRLEVTRYYPEFYNRSIDFLATCETALFTTMSRIKLIICCHGHVMR